MSDAESTTQRLGDYELVHALKTGGMGDVWLARKRGTGGFEKLVAIKTIRTEFANRQELRTMFLDEARILSRLDHPAVAQVYDFGEAQNTLFLAMEYVPGLSLVRLCDGTIPPSVACRIVAHACRALHAAHELTDLDGTPLQVVHRDVSPDNIMLTFDGHVKVLDFGIALMRGRQAPVTEYGMIKGKPPYLSPEQVRGEQLDRRTDIWSMGVVLWELLVGQHLFGGESLYAVAASISDQEIPPPSRRAGQLPDGLDRSCLLALSRSVDSRYPTALAFAEDLEDIADAAAAPSVEEYARESLRESREAHQAWLRSILVGGEPAGKPPGRPTGMRTAVAETVPDAPPPPSALPKESAIAIRPPAAEIMAPPVDAPERRFSWPLLVALLAVLAAVAGAAYMMGGEPAVVATFDASDLAAAADASMGVEVGLADAQAMDATLAPVDATPIDAGAPDARRRRVPQPRDAATSNSTQPLQTGTLTVAASPYALVRVDGKEVGSTPILRLRLPEGEHLVELLYPDTGKVRVRKSVRIEANQEARVVEK